MVKEGMAIEVMETGAIAIVDHEEATSVLGETFVVTVAEAAEEVRMMTGAEAVAVTAAIVDLAIGAEIEEEMTGATFVRAPFKQDDENNKYHIIT